MSRHTPGPWKYGGPVRRDSIVDRHGLSQQTYEIGTEDELTPPGIAVVNIRDEESEANARLIAVAPELLEACETLPLEMLDSEESLDAADFVDHSRQFLRAMRIARNAIAKAKGEDLPTE